MDLILTKDEVHSPSYRRDFLISATNLEKNNHTTFKNENYVWRMIEMIGFYEPGYETVKNRLSECRNLSQLADTLQWYGNFRFYTKNNSTFERIYQDIKNSGSDVGKPYYIYRGNKAMCEFLFINWSYSRSARKNAEIWRAISNFIYENYCEPEGESIAVKDIH